ncbi:MAG: UvrD-helicase domain-containing protein [Acidobacteria bacterium]|nr:UvrD-helicase domain-containing protein [Acidobacteriota bacterium]MCA1627481.1 UvrD-helicase domain-containing protein [Acidobacteriota bacterium]
MKEQRVLLPEQAAAAYEISKHISVTAGPGSGKTTVLVERYLHILREYSLSIDQIVAITFTNRAANEMRERLRADLHHMLRIASDEERRRWINYKRTLDGAVITTIHGFCARLLREFPIEARVDPQFLLLDEHRAAMMLELRVEEVLSDFISGGHVEISRLTLGVGRSRLAAALAQVYRDARGQGLSLEDLALATARVHATEEDHAHALEELEETLAGFLNVRRTTPAAMLNKADVADAWSKLGKLLTSIPSHETLADYCRGVEAFRAPRPALRGAVADHVKALDELIWAKDLKGRVPQVCLDLFARQYALEMVNLLLRIDLRLNEEKQKLSALDFDDLELRTLVLLERPEVLARISERYRFFLVDEFQDTNPVQRVLLERAALTKGRRPANLFIVGDRKQSIYGFRGADVDVFREMTATLLAHGGEEKRLQLNFRSQPPLIAFFNHLFPRMFQVPDDLPPSEYKNLDQLGFVKHEPSEPRRELRDEGPLIEMLVTTKPSLEDDPRAQQDSRVLDAQQVARRILALKKASPELKYGNIALLFRAMTQVQIYESVFRRANIPYQTVLGRGFYEREEITDLIQLLRFLDNKTDEIALAAVLRSPLCGISDNALLALRCAPWLAEIETVDPLRGFSITRRLYTALRRHGEIAYISDEEHQLLERASALISELVARRHHYPIHDLLRFAVNESEYMTVTAANFDGAQRLANVERLFTLAARFESSGTHLIRDFVRYVEEFEAIGSRESEGPIDQAADAVRLMTIHQAKGLEFPVVFIPDLQRLSRVGTDNWVLLDRHLGLTLKVPDGRGSLVAGCTYTGFERRHAWREQFENMRLLYVAASRAEDRLIMTGVADQLASLTRGNECWLKWIWQSLELGERSTGGVVELDDDVQLQLTVNLAEEVADFEPQIEDEPQASAPPIDSLVDAFPLVQQIERPIGNAIYRFSVTQLINYHRCPRQYYFDRVLQLPSSDELAVWNNADAPEPPANLTATLKGAVIHRFCERYTADRNAEECLRESFAEVVRLRQAQLADRLVDINFDAAIRDLLPLAKNYLTSDVFKRVEAAPKIDNSIKPAGQPGLWSEVSFRLRRPQGILFGVIDKLLVTSEGVEIIDFKTNRILPSKTSEPPPEPPKETQFAFDFDEKAAGRRAWIDAAVRTTSEDYELQMQSYALAVRELLPELDHSQLKVTLHFLEPNMEIHLSDALLEPEQCRAAINEAMLRIISSADPLQFPVKTAPHCRACNFLRLCTAGREWVREK